MPYLNVCRRVYRLGECRVYRLAECRRVYRLGECRVYRLAECRIQPAGGGGSDNVDIVSIVTLLK